jgi:hypothetical protein
MDGDDRPPICPRCGVTMVPAALSAGDEHEVDTLEGPLSREPDGCRWEGCGVRRLA